MRYVVEVPNFGEFAAPRVFAEVARRAEESGWDALLVWDHVVGEKDLRWEIADPWILLTAAALATRRIRLGTAITPVPRRRAENGLTDRPFDIVIGGTTPGGSAAQDLVGPLADLGVTWWDERRPWDDMERTGPTLRRIEQGPPGA